MCITYLYAHTYIAYIHKYTTYFQNTYTHAYVCILKTSYAIYSDQDFPSPNSSYPYLHILSLSLFRKQTNTQTTTKTK